MAAQIFDLAKYQSKKAVPQEAAMIEAAREIYNSIFPTDPNAFNAALHGTAPSEMNPQDPA